MLFAPIHAALELRKAKDGGVMISGTFPYDSETQIYEKRFETFKQRAFQPADEVHLLAQHDYEKPLASLGAGSLTIDNNDAGLSFEARITPDIADTSYGRDALALIRSHLASGLSPGFIVPANGETVTRRDDGIIRTIRQAMLHELSIVTRPAYSKAQVEARSWVSDKFKPQPAPKYQMFMLPDTRWRR